MRKRSVGKAKQGPGPFPARLAARLPRYLSRAILLLSCLALFVPLVVNSDFYYPYVFLKSLLFRVTVQTMAFLYVLLAVMCPFYRPRFNRIICTFLVYFGIMLVSSLPGVSVSAWSSWWGDFSRMGGMISQLHLLVFFLVLSQTLTLETEWIILFAASLLSGVFMGLTGLIQFLGLDYLYGGTAVDRIRGAAGNSDFFALLMVLNFFIVLWFLSHQHKKEAYSLAARIWTTLLLSSDVIVLGWSALAGESRRFLSPEPQAFPIVAVVLFLHAVTLTWLIVRRRVWIGNAILSLVGFYFLYWTILSQTRFAVIGLVGSLASISVLYLLRAAGSRLRWMTAGLLLLVCLLPVYVWLSRQSAWVQDNPALRRLTSLTYADAAPRLLAWKTSARSVLDHPLLGWGPENYQKAFDSHFPPQLYTSLESEVWFDHAHNMLLDVGTTVGLPGLAAYLAFYGLVFTFLLRRWFRTRGTANTLVAGGILLSYFIQSLFIFDTINTDVVVLAVLAYVAFLHFTHASGDAQAPDSHRHLTAFAGKGWVTVPLAAAVLFPAFWYTVKRPYDSNVSLTQGIALEKGLDPQSGKMRFIYMEEIGDLFKRADRIQTTGRYEVREEYANYASELAKEPLVPAETKIVVVREALALLEESIRQDPAFARRYMYPSSLINMTFGVLQETHPGLARALAEKTLSWLQRAEGLAPTRPQVFLERGRALASLKRIDEAASAFQVVTKLIPWVKSPHLELFALYVSAGRFEDAAKEREKMAALPLALSVSDYDSLIRLCISRKAFSEAVALYQRRLALTPGDAVAMAHLAATYRDMGDMESARRTALSAAALSPQIAAGLQEFLKTLEDPK